MSRPLNYSLILALSLLAPNYAAAERPASHPHASGAHAKPLLLAENSGVEKRHHYQPRKNPNPKPVQLGDTATHERKAAPDSGAPGQGWSDVTGHHDRSNPERSGPPINEQHGLGRENSIECLRSTGCVRNDANNAPRPGTAIQSPRDAQSSDTDGRTANDSEARKITSPRDMQSGQAWGASEIDFSGGL